MSTPACDPQEVCDDPNEMGTCSGRRGEGLGSRQASTVKELSAKGRPSESLGGEQETDVGSVPPDGAAGRPDGAVSFVAAGFCPAQNRSKRQAFQKAGVTLDNLMKKAPFPLRHQIATFHTGASAACDRPGTNSPFLPSLFFSRRRYE